MNEDERLAKERLERFSLKGLHEIEETEIAGGYRELLTNEQLLEGVEIISRNAEELLEDARLLFEHGRYARSASLAVLALEESFKKFMLFVYPLVMDDSKGRKEFWNTWRNHRVKSSTPATAPFLFGRINEGRRSELTEVLGRWADALKQAGLYADCVEEAGQPKWALPSETVDKDKASKAIELAAMFVVSLPDDSVRLMLADAGSSDNALEVLLTLADRLEDFSEGQDWGLLTMAPNNIRHFVEATLASIAEESAESDDTR